MRRAIILAAALSMPVAAASAQTRAELTGTWPTASVAAGGVEARLSLQPDKADPTLSMPRVEILASGKVVLERVIAEAALERPMTAARIVELDPANNTAEVVISAYTGGAHCCTVLVAANRVDGRWTLVDVATVDGYSDFVDDLDGNGVVEFVIPDNRFLYAFDAYAMSVAPLRVSEMRAGKLVDVSREERYRFKLREQLGDLDKLDAEARRYPGVIVGRLGVRILLGESAAAWDEFDTMAEGIEPVRQCPPAKAECGEADYVAVPFRTAVREFMKANGYGE